MVEGGCLRFNNAITAGKEVQTIDPDLSEIAHATRL